LLIDGKSKAFVSLNYFTDGKVLDGQTIKGKSVGGNDAGYGSMDLAGQLLFFR
jgi:hypothetical protein